jgi:hypothetical protein
MSKSDLLFELIKSLTKTEKGYFKKHQSFGSTDGDKNYLRLFDLIDNQKTYDEAEIKKKLKDAKTIKQLPALKNYLYKQILKALESYHESDLSDIRSTLNQIEILYHKGLYYHYRPMMDRLKLKAEKLEKHTYSLELNLMELGIGIRSRNYEVFAEEHKMLQESFSSTIEQLSDFSSIYRIYWRCHPLGRRLNSHPDDKEALRMLDDIIQVPAMLEPAKDRSTLAKAWYEQNMAIYHFFHKNVEQALIHTKNILVIYDQKPEVFSNDMQYIFTTYYNYSLDLIMLYRFEEAAEMIASLSQIEAKRERHKNILFQYKYSLLFQSYQTQGRFAEEESIVNEFIQELPGKENVMVNIFKARIFYTIARHYFILENFDACITWTNKLFDMQHANPDRRLHASTIFIDILCHIELHHEQLALSKIRAAQTYFKQVNQLNAQLKNMLRIFNKLATVVVANQKNPRLLELKHDLGDVQEESAIHQIMDSTEYITWIEARIHRNSLLSTEKLRLSAMREGRRFP